MESNKKEHISKSILEIGGGMLMEEADHELAKILKNIVDPNTAPTKARTLTIKLKFTPNEERSQISIETSSSVSLAPNKSKKVVLFNTPYKDPETGIIKTMLKEIMAVAPGQMNFDGMIAEPETFLIGMGK